MDRRDIVVIGASAGGLDVMRALLQPLAADLPAALFLVTHLAPGPSRLDTVLATHTSLQVRFAQDGEAIRPGTLSSRLPTGT